MYKDYFKMEEVEVVEYTSRTFWIEENMPEVQNKAKRHKSLLWKS